MGSERRSARQAIELVEPAGSKFGADAQHDLRHRFAVTRLATWHRDNADVQALLPLLVTYLGHARYSDAAYYVTGTADLLGMAADRAFADGGTS